MDRSRYRTKLFQFPRGFAPRARGPRYDCKGRTLSRPAPLDAETPRSTGGDAPEGHHNQLFAQVVANIGEALDNAATLRREVRDANLTMKERIFSKNLALDRRFKQNCESALVYIFTRRACFYNQERRSGWPTPHILAKGSEFAEYLPGDVFTGTGRLETPFLC